MIYFKNKSILLITVLFLIFSLILITNCESKNKRFYRYEIRGRVMHNGKKRDAIWLTDSLEINNNFLKYHNSDGTEVVIPSPYILIDHKYDKVIKDTIPAF